MIAEKDEFVAFVFVSQIHGGSSDDSNKFLVISK